MTDKMKITLKTVVNSTGLALVLGITARRVQQLAEEGVIEKTDGGYLLVDSIRKYMALKAPEYDEEAEEIERRKKKAEADLKAAKATVAKLEAEELKGKFHRAEDVKALTEEMIYAFRGAVMALPGRVTVDCAACDGNAAAISDVIRREIYTMLNELAEYNFDDPEREGSERERLQYDAMEEEKDDE